MLNWNFVIVDHLRVNYVVWLPCQNLVLIRFSPLVILQFYDFASLAGKCLTTPPFGFFLGLNSVKLCAVIKTPKRYILGRGRVIYAINGKNPSRGSSWVRSREKKYNQDRTTNNNLAIANRSRVNCAHNTSRAFTGLKSRLRVTQGHCKQNH